VALLLLAADRTGSVAIGGTLVATLLVPHVVAAPLVGTLVDRSPRPEAVLAGAVALFAAGLAVPVVLLGNGPLWPSFLALAGAGCCGPAITGGLTSHLAALVGPRQQGRAFGLDSLFYNLASMAGPAVVGLGAAALGSGPATVMLAAAAALGALGTATQRRPPVDQGRATTSRRSLLGGARAIVANPQLRALTLTTTLGQIGPGGLAVVATVLATSVHRPAISGLLLSTSAVGSLLGSLLWTWRPLPAQRAPAVTAWTMIGAGAPLAAAAATDSLPLVTALFGLSGFFVGPFAAALFLARNLLAPESLRAQVFTLGAGLKVGASALGAGLLGLATHLPVSVGLVLVAASPMLAGTLGLLIDRRRRHRRAA